MRVCRLYANSVTVTFSKVRQIKKLSHELLAQFYGMTVAMDEGIVSSDAVLAAALFR